MQKKVCGFTLIELIIVVGIIAIIATIAIPGLIRAKISADEGSAAATLRSIATSQQVFTKSNTVDQDQDGLGEFGVFNELTGATKVRGMIPNPLQQPRLKVADLTISLEAGDTAIKSGYVFQMFLPGTIQRVTDIANTPLPPFDKGDPVQASAINQQENNWICYAWPYAFNSSGTNAFLCTQAAEVYKSANTNPLNNSGYWYGDSNRPLYDSAMSKIGGNPTFTFWKNIRTKDNNPANIVDPNHTWTAVGG